MRKTLLIVWACLLSVLCAWADEPYRNHRYDVMKALSVGSDNIVFVGNSITDMHQWWEAFGNAKILNRGNSGAVTSEMLSNLESVLAGKPAKIFLMMGTNDVGTTGLNNATYIAKQLRIAVKRITKESPTTQLYVQSILPSNAGLRTLALEQECNDSIEKICAEFEGVTYIDLWDDFTKIAEGDNTYTLDNVHLTGAAYRTWCKKIAQYIGSDAACQYPDDAANNFSGLTGVSGMKSSHFAMAGVSDGDIILIGDCTFANGEWQELLHSSKVKNRASGYAGWPGADIATNTAMIPAIFKGRTDNGTPAQVYLLTGISDVNGASDLTSAKTAYKNMVDSVRKYAPTAKIVICGLLPVSTAATNTGNITTFNTYLQSLASTDGNIEYLDTYTPFVTTANVANTDYLTGNYLYGKGYAKLSGILAEKMGEGFTATTEDSAAAAINLFATRNTLASAITTAEAMPIGEGAGKYSQTNAADLLSKVSDAYTLLASSDTTGIAAKGTAITSALATLKTNINQPTASTTDSEVWYELYTPLRSNKYLTSNGAGSGVTGVAHTGYARSMWKFVSRTDGSFDIVNRKDGSYLNPTATYNTQLTTTATQPSSGWTFSYADEVGYYIIYSGSTQLNQTNNDAVYSYGNGNTRNDTGCEYALSLVTSDPVAEPVTTLFETTTITDGTFARDTRYYTLQLDTNGYYISNPGDAASISLSATSTKFADKDLWCFTGNDADGYTIYNKEAGTGKALAAPSSITSSNDGTAYVVLKDTASHDGYTIKWQFASSTDLGSDVTAYYMYAKGSTSYKVNNRDSKLAFWVSGQDHGSSLQVLFAKQDIPVNLASGSYNTANTYSKTWTSTLTDPQLTLDAGYNNMMKSGTTVVACPGQYKPQTYTLSVPADYSIALYEFKYKSNTEGKAVTITAGDTTLTSTDTEQSFVLKDSINDQTATFVVNASAATDGVALTDFYVTVLHAIEEPEPWTDIFKQDGSHYRIPAIAKAHNGNLIAISDYRTDGADIGMTQNATHLYYRVSKDNGATWEASKVLAKGQGTSRTDALHTGFGDGCIVADRESDKVLVTSCAGNVSYHNGTRQSHLYFVSFLSEDNGATWSSEPTDLTEQIYTQFDKSKAHGPIKSFFVGSGKIHQSRYTKVGEYYRLYAAALVKDSAGTNTNFVIYSDDFGATWKILGGVENAPIPSGGDEPKAEELPDGSVVISSRCTGGRYYNIFTSTNIADGEGSWGTAAFSGTSNNGVTATSNSCNGEILILPAVRRADSQPVYIALQSLPFGSGRANVGIHYKELSAPADFSTPANFAKDWDGKHQSSKLSSAYSTMVKQANDSIAFLYEECTYGSGGYTIVYKAYSLETITDSLYRFPTAADNFDADFLLKDCGATKYADAQASMGEYVGMLKQSGLTSISAAHDAFAAAPTLSNYEALNTAIAAAERVELQNNWNYTLQNKLYSTYLSVATSSFEGVESAGEAQYFTAYKQTDGSWKLYNANAEKWLGKTAGTETEVPQANESNAGTYTAASSSDGFTVFSCTNPSASGPICIHLAARNRLVEWYSSADASMWKVLPIAESTGIEEAISLLPEDAAAATIYDLQGRRVLKPAKGIYIVNGRKRLFK